MLVQALIMVESLVVLLLLGALIVGQPAATQADHDRLRTDATLIAQLRAELPVPTPRLCPGYTRC